MDSKLDLFLVSEKCRGEKLQEACEAKEQAVQGSRGKADPGSPFVALSSIGKTQAYFGKP